MEEGLRDAFSASVSTSPPSCRKGAVDAAIICVSTPVNPGTHAPELGNLRVAAPPRGRALRAQYRSSSSGAPCRWVRAATIGAAELLAQVGARHGWPSRPSRTIQGQALRELEELPQVVERPRLRRPRGSGGRSSPACHAQRGRQVSSLEAAELVKLVNNCHTGSRSTPTANEVALMAERWKLDPLEVIRAANLEYPRPDLAKPGFVGGACLSKDPYILISASRAAGLYALARGAGPRGSTTHLPVHVAERLIDADPLRRAEAPRGARLAVLGWAYKGWPPTDDMRGTPIVSMLPLFRGAPGLELRGHDHLGRGGCHPRRSGAEPVTPEAAFDGADAVLVITNHPSTRSSTWGGSCRGCARPAVTLRLLAHPRRGDGARRQGVLRGASAMPRALILGGAGFIGYHLALRLAAEGHALTLVDDLSRGRRDRETGSALRPAERHPACRRTSRAPDALARLPRRAGTAPTCSRPSWACATSETDPARVVRTNTLALLHLLDWLAPESGVSLLRLDQRDLRRRVSRRGHAARTDARGRARCPVSGHPGAALRLRREQDPGRGRRDPHGARPRAAAVVGRFHNVYGPRNGRRSRRFPSFRSGRFARENPFRLYGADQRRAFCCDLGRRGGDTALTASAGRRGADRQHRQRHRGDTDRGPRPRSCCREACFEPALDARQRLAGSVARRCPDIGRLRALTGFVPQGLHRRRACATPWRWYRDWRGQRPRGAVTEPRRVIPNAVPHLAGNEWKYLKECLDTNWVSSVGPFRGPLRAGGGGPCRRASRRRAR